VLKSLRATLATFFMLTLITGVAYPIVITVVAQLAFPHQANGSLIERRTGPPGYARVTHEMANRYFWNRLNETSAPDNLIGSELIGQPFTNPRYFWSRPSATSPTPYNAAASTGSNYGPTNPAQLDAVRQRVADVRKAGDDGSSPVPIDLVTASGSGLDPHISPAAADYQVPRIAKARGIGDYVIRRLLAENIEDRTFRLLGEPRVNVLKLNLALDELKPE
jgi:K+-transporting ATPase ATPase C chain